VTSLEKVNEAARLCADSSKRFSDGRRWKIEIPSIESVDAFAASVDTAKSY